jgi:hypothetical protein
MKIKTFNLQEFASFLYPNKDNPNYSSWIDIISVYESTVGGCNCSRNSRLQNADNYLRTKLTNSDPNSFQIFKTTLEVDKLIFNDVNNNLILEI